MPSFVVCRSFSFVRLFRNIVGRSEKGESFSGSSSRSGLLLLLDLHIDSLSGDLLLLPVLLACLLPTTADY
jgi:hypothetical protein